jgi:hypothetical protein
LAWFEVELFVKIRVPMGDTARTSHHMVQPFAHNYKTLPDDTTAFIPLSPRAGIPSTNITQSSLHPAWEKHPISNRPWSNLLQSGTADCQGSMPAADASFSLINCAIVAVGPSQRRGPSIECCSTMLQGDTRQDRALEVSLVRHGDDGSPAAICAAKKPLATSAKCLRDAQSELSGESPSTAMNCNAICDSSATDSRSQNRSLTQSRSHAVTHDRSQGSPIPTERGTQNRCRLRCTQTRSATAGDRLRQTSGVQ